MLRLRFVSILLVLGLLCAQYAGAATTYHVYKMANDVSPNFSTLQGAVLAVRAGTGGDTIWIDDSETYTLTTPTAIAAINKPNTTIAASPGCNPVLVTASGTFAFNVTAAGCRIGSLDGGRIIFDGGGSARRAVYFDNTMNSVGWEAPSINTLENCTFRRFGVSGATSQASWYGVIVGQASGTKSMTTSTLFRLRYLDFEFPSGPPVNPPDTSNNYTAIRCQLSGIGVAEIEHVKANTLTGYIVTGGHECTSQATNTGVINISNCQFVYDDPTMLDHRRMGSPVALMSMFSGANVNGFTANINKCYIRSDSRQSAYLSPSQISPGRTAGTIDTSQSLGAITLVNYAKNVLNVTSSVLVGCGNGINIDSAHSTINLANSDIYVPTAAMVSPGNFINISPRTWVSSSADHQCTVTQCNFHGLNGSDIQAATRGAGSVFKMVKCNDWSPANAYATNWVTDNCIQPGQNPNYGGSNDPSVALASLDFTVGNTTLSAQNIGANIDFAPAPPLNRAHGWTTLK